MLLHFWESFVSHLSCSRTVSSVNDGQNFLFSCQRRHLNKGFLVADGARDPTHGMAAGNSHAG
jgi:hypothetical protein